MLLENQPLKFSATTIAKAAAARAEALFAEIDHTELDQARAALDAEVDKAIIHLCTREYISFASSDGPSGAAPVVRHQIAERDDPERAAVLTVPISVMHRFRSAEGELRSKRATVQKLRAMAAAFGSQDEGLFELDMEDIAFLGLDQEQPEQPVA